MVPEPSQRPSFPAYRIIRPRKRRDLGTLLGHRNSLQYSQLQPLVPVSQVGHGVKALLNLESLTHVLECAEVDYIGPRIAAVDLLLAAYHLYLLQQPG